MRVNRSLWKVAGASLAVLVLLAGFAAAAFGQSATGTITGTITDPKGLAMVGVNVLVHSVDTGIDHAAVTTNDQGLYLVPLLQPGNYDIIVSQAGFSTVKRASVVLQVGATARVDIEMPVSAQQTLVTVTTEIPLLETEKTEQSQNVTETLVSNLPVSSRRWEQFVLLTPGVVADGVNGAMSFHGINNLYNNNTIDGANNNYNYDGGSRGGPNNDGYTYSGDSVREFQVSSSGFGAEIGQSAGGSVNAVTKSGTNQLHGDLFYNGRAANFNALDPVTKNNAAAAPAGTSASIPTPSVHQQHQWGGSIGGPLIKDKLFFFFTDDGYRKVNPNIVTPVQLSPSIQNLTCPTAVAGAAAGTTAPTAAQCQAAKDYIFVHYLGVFPRTLRQDIELLKLDYQVSQSNHINVVANIRDWHQTSSPLLQNGTGDSYIQDRFFIANWTRVMGSNKVNEFRYQWGKDNPFQSLAAQAGLAKVTLTNLFAYGTGGGGPGRTTESRNQVSDNFSWTKGAHAIKFGADINYIWEDIRGANTAGGQYQYSSAVGLGNNISCVAPTAGTQTTNTILCDWLVDVYGSNTQGTAICPSATLPLPAGCLIGQHFNNFTQLHEILPVGPTQSFLYQFPDTDVAGFIQDTWKIRRNVTINAGLRYDVQLLAALPNGVAALISKGILPAGSTDRPIFDTYLSSYPNEYDGIQPRLGIAWNIKNTVIRAGGGIFFAKTENHNVKGVMSGAAETANPCKTPEATLGNCSLGALSFPNVYFAHQVEEPLFNVPLPGAVVAVEQTPPSLIVPNPSVGFHAVDPTLRRPRVYSANFAVEQQLPWNMNLSVSYSFAKGVSLPRGADFNISSNHFDPNYCATGVSGGTQTCNGLSVTKTYDVVNSAGVTQQSITQPFYSSRPAITGASAFSSRVDTSTGLLNGNMSDVDTIYNGIIIALRKPLSHGLEVIGNYTMSHARDNGQQTAVNGGGEGQVGLTAIDPFNHKAEWGNSGTDVRNRFTASVSYSPTFGKGITNNVVKQFADGWSISSAVIAQNGSHYTAFVQGSSASAVTYSGFASGSAIQTNFVYSPLDGGMGGAGVDSPGNPSAQRVAWLAPGSFVLPNLYNVDLRLTKQFAIKERYHIEIRGEAFNLFNTTLIQAVSANAYSYATPTAGSATCPLVGTVGAPSPHASTVQCMVPVASFGQAATTSGNNLGARQMQAGVRFEF